MENKNIAGEDPIVQEDTTPAADLVTEPVTEPVIATPKKKGGAENPVDAKANISQVALEELMKRLTSLEEDGRIRAQLDDRNTVNKIEDLRRQGKLVKSVKINMVEGKEVIGYRMSQNEVYVSDGKLIENQSMKVYFLDDSVKEYTLKMWNTLPTFQDHEVISETKNEDGDLILGVRNTEGKEFSINVRYVN